MLLPGFKEVMVLLAGTGKESVDYTDKIALFLFVQGVSPWSVALIASNTEAVFIKAEERSVCQL